MKRQNEFVYNEATRIHTLGGKIIPSVSNIVSPLVDYSEVPKDRLERKRDLGIAFHDAIRLYLHDDLDEESLDEQLIIPMKQFREFWLDYEFKNLPSPAIIAIEKPFCNTKLKYCGKPDLVTEDAVYDWKLRKLDPVGDPIRMAGYAGLIGDYPILSTRKIIVEFSLDGRYKVHDAEKKQAWSFFRLLLERFHKNNEWEKKIEQWRKST